MCTSLHGVIAIHGTHPAVISTSAQLANIHPLSVSSVHLPVSILVPCHPVDLMPSIQTPALRLLSLAKDSTSVPFALRSPYAVPRVSYI